MGKPHTSAGTVSTENVLTIPAIAGGKVELESVGFSFDVAPSAAVLLTVESPSGTVLHRWFVSAAGAGPINYGGSCVDGAKDQAMVIRLAAATGSIGHLNAVTRNH